MHSREQPAATLGKPQILWVASTESPSAILGKPQILWVACAEQNMLPKLSDLISIETTS